MHRPPLSKDSNCPCGSGHAYGDCCVPREAAGCAVRGAAPTRFHAETVFEQMVEHLGDRAVVETANGGVLLPEHVRHLPGPPLTVRTVVYEVSRPDCGTGYATEFHPHGLDGRHLSTRAAIVTWIDPQ